MRKTGGGQYAPELKQVSPVTAGQLSKIFSNRGAISAGMSCFGSKKLGFNNRIGGGQYAPEYPWTNLGRK